MAFLRSILKVSDTFSHTKKCLVPCSHFGSEVPSPPKRPLTAYMIFCKENRKQLMEQNPTLSTVEQIKVLANKWNHLSDSQKKPYESSARRSVQAYGEEHRRFYESLTREQKEALDRIKAEKAEAKRIFRNKKTLRDSGMPKSPTSAYALFVQSEAKRNAPIASASEFIKKVAKLWKSLPEESKKGFVRLAEEDRRRHAREMQDWERKVSTLQEGKKILKAYNATKGTSKRPSTDSLVDNKSF